MNITQFARRVAKNFEAHENQQLDVLTKKLRTCLRCDKYFRSMGTQNRMCDPCKRKPERYL